MREIINHGAKCNNRNYYVETTLHSIARCSFPHGDGIADISITEGCSVNAKGSKGQTALHYAANNSNIILVDLLLRKNAEIDPTDFDGNTPLMYAADKGNKDIVKALLNHNANTNQINDTGLTPLILSYNR